MISMDNKEWFTVEKIDNDTFVISEYGHYEETHCYLLIGKNTALLIDTGLGVQNIKTIIDKLTNLPLQVVLTHSHWDHIGGIKHFENISIHSLETLWLTSKFPLSVDNVKMQISKENDIFPKDFIIDAYQIPRIDKVSELKDEMVINLGSRTVKVIHTPGHSPGHCCFYELERCYLYSGDLIYKGANLDCFYPTTDPIEFKKSILKVLSLNVKRILPGHHFLEIENDIIQKIYNAFCKLENDAEGLTQGRGIFNFEEFGIHL